MGEIEIELREDNNCDYDAYKLRSEFDCIDSILFHSIIGNKQFFCFVGQWLGF